MKKILIFLVIPLALLAKAEQDSVSIRQYESDQVIVIDDEFNVSEECIIQVLNSTEDLLKYSNSIDLISRANFASEAVVRGYTQDRLNVTIDGMRMYSACIDKMDPIISYIEVENLKSFDVSADKSDMSNGVSVGGSLNFITNKPSHNDEFKLVMDNQFSSASEFYNSKGRINYSDGNFATLLSYSVKKSGNYTAGNNSIINNSSYSKENYKLNMSYNANPKTSHGLEYIYDHSADVGYPSLIMDTRETRMNMISYQIDMRNMSDNILNWDSKLYYNKISHLMDDYDRSEDEINNRIVMPGMYMPMNGTTETMGFVTKNKMLLGQDILNLSFEAFRMNAFSDMKMEMLEDQREMYLVNLGDIETYNGGLSVGFMTQLDDSVLLKLNGRVDYTTRAVRSEFARAEAESYWGNNYSIAGLQFNTSANLQYDLTDNQNTSITLSRVERVPTHIEAFGYYVYNIADNSIYIGNPDLNKEKSYSVNLGYNYNSEKYSIKVNVYNDYIVDYIAGLEDDGITVVEQFAQSFKLFQNIGDANILGTEASIEYTIDDNFSFLTKLKYQFSQSLKYNEALPFTPPLSGLLNLSYNTQDYIGVVSAEFATQQNNISQNINIEDTTPGYVILNLRNNYKINDTFTARFGVENILDKYYYTHFSVNNLPNPGRNFYLGLVVRL